MCILLGKVKSLYSSGQTAGRRHTFTPVVLDSRQVEISYMKFVVECHEIAPLSVWCFFLVMFKKESEIWKLTWWFGNGLCGVVVIKSCDVTWL